jgi:hypothetical protein
MTAYLEVGPAVPPVRRRGPTASKVRRKRDPSPPPSVRSSWIGLHAAFPALASTACPSNISFHPHDEQFQGHNRKSADPRKAYTNPMIQFAKNTTDDEIKAAGK